MKQSAKYIYIYNKNLFLVDEVTEKDLDCLPDNFDDVSEFNENEEISTEGVLKKEFRDSIRSRKST